MHDSGNRLLELGLLQQSTGGLEGLFRQLQDLLILFFQRRWCRNFTEVLKGHRYGAVDQVAPAIGQLIIDTADEFIPGEVRVIVFRTGHGDEVAQGIWAKLRQEILDIDDNALGRGELGTRHGQVLRGDNLRRQVQLAVLVKLTALVALAGIAQKLGRPDLGVEGDIVLALEVIVAGLRVLPEVLPCLRLTGAVCPLDGGRQVTDDRIEPHVELLSVIVLPALNGDRNAPINIARHGARAHILQQVQGELQDVRAPILTGGKPLLQLLLDGGQIQQEVLGFNELWGLAVDLGYGVDQVHRVKLVATLIALVTAGAIRAADGAGALNIAVRQGASGRRRNSTLGGLFEHVAIGIQALEEFLYHGVVVTSGGTGKKIVGQAEVG